MHQPWMFAAMSTLFLFIRVNAPAPSGRAGHAVIVNCHKHLRFECMYTGGCGGRVCEGQSAGGAGGHPPNIVHAPEILRPCTTGHKCRASRLQTSSRWDPALPSQEPSHHKRSTSAHHKGNPSTSVGMEDEESGTGTQERGTADLMMFRARLGVGVGTVCFEQSC